MTAKPKSKAKVPKAAELEYGFKVAPPPPDVKAKLGTTGLWIGVDIETHGWEESKGIKGSIGQHGFYNLCAPCDLDARVVQIGWAFPDSNGELVVKERLVFPVGFSVSLKATRVHRITHQHAVAHGLPLKSVLLEFMDDVEAIYAQGGRLVCHHMEFVGGLVEALYVCVCGAFHMCAWCYMSDGLFTSSLACAFLCLFVYLHVFVWLPVCLHFVVCLFVYLFVCLFAELCIFVLELACLFVHSIARSIVCVFVR